MVSLLPSCPVVASAPGFPSTQTLTAEQQLEGCPTDRSILWEKPAKETTSLSMFTSEEERERLRGVANMASSCPSAATVPGFPSRKTEAIEPMKAEREPAMVDLMPTCPRVAGTFGFPSLEKQTEESPVDSEAIWQKPLKEKDMITIESTTHLDRLKGDVELMKNMVAMEPSCPVVASIPGFPSSKRPEIEQRQSMMLQACPDVSNIAGMASRLCIQAGKDWPVDQLPLWEKPTKERRTLLMDGSKKDQTERKAMMLLSTSCPKETRIPGFPTVSQPSVVYHGPNMVDHLSSCPRVSKIPGLPSTDEASDRSWTLDQEPLWEKKMKMKSALVTDISQKDKDEMKQMVALVPSCPKDSCIPGFPSVPQHTVVCYGQSMVSLLPSCPKDSRILGFPSLAEPSSKKWTIDYKPLTEKQRKNRTVMIEDRLDRDEMKAMSALVPTCPKEARIPGFPSVPQPKVICYGSNVVNHLPSCPKISIMAGFPSTQKADSKDWKIDHQPLWEKQKKEKKCMLILDSFEIDKEMKGMVSIVPSCPKESQTPGFPTVPRPSVVYFGNMPSMVNVSSSCPKVSRIPGFPSSHDAKSKEWTTNKEPLWEGKTKEKQVSLVDRSEKDNKTMKPMVSLVPSCPKQARIPGFPSLPSPEALYYGPNMVNLLPLCPQVSSIPGFATVKGDKRVGWTAEKGLLVEKPLNKKAVVIDTSIVDKKSMRNMASMVPSCPKVASIPGFPSCPNAKDVNYGLNIVNLLPLCPQVSNIPGFPSIEVEKGAQWVAKQEPLMKRPLKKSEVMISRSAVDRDRMKNMFALSPSCPGATRIPGFPSTPRCNMLSLVCPKVSSFPGCASTEGATKLEWLVDPKPFWDKLQSKTVFAIDSPKHDREIIKAMLALAPSCPEASRIPGFPSAPRPKAKMDMTSLVPYCPKASNIKGFSSMTEVPCTGWLIEPKPLWVRPKKKRLEMITPLAGKDRPYSYNVKSMMSLVTSCPKEARIPGFPSAQAQNRTPNMVSLCASSPCVSSVPGFPSLRMLSHAAMDVQDGKINTKPFFEKPRNERKAIIEERSAEDKAKMKHMVAMAPSCPHVTQIPGFPSIPQPKPAKEQKTTALLLSNPKESKPQELPDGKPTHSALYQAEELSLVPSCPAEASIPCLPTGNPGTALGEKDVLCELFIVRIAARITVLFCNSTCLLL